MTKAEVVKQIFDKSKEPLLSVAELAVRTGFTQKAIRRRIERGTIVPRYVDGALRFGEKEVAKLLEEKPLRRKRVKDVS